MRSGFYLCALLLSVCPALAQEDLVIDQSKVYASDPAACTALEGDGLSGFEALEHLVLSFPDGIQSMEFHCGFHDIKSRANTPVLFADAVCELPGELYPDTFAIAPYGANTIQVVSSYDLMMEATGVFPGNASTTPGTTIYHRCDNLSENPFD